MSAQLLEAVGLDAGYGAAATVVRDLDLAVHPGQIVALLGPNGAGKTTTLLTLAGVLAPLGGTLIWHGRDDNSGSQHRRARQGLGLVTERRAVLTRMTVEENLRVSRCDFKRAFELFPELEPHRRRKVALLSGGQQQMLALTRSLARPGIQVLLVDELSLGLAPQVVDRLLAVLKTAADDGIGVVLVEQHVAKALTVADHVCLLRRGRLDMSFATSEGAGRQRELLDRFMFGSDGASATAGTSPQHRLQAGAGSPDNKVER